MHIHSLIYFLAVIDYHGFSQAALEQNISQSALSKHIQSLEEEFHVTLFNRNKHTLSLTEAGMVFARHAESFVKDYNTLQNLMDDYSESGKSSLKIISVPVLHMYKTSDLISEFKKQHPQIRLTIMEAPQPTVINEMNRQNVDLAIVRSNWFPHKDTLEFFPLCYDELTLVCNTKHRFAKKRSVAIAEIAGEQLFLLRPGIFDYEIGLKNQGLDVKLGQISVQLHNVFTLAEYLKKENAVTLLMGAMADVVCEDGSLRKIPFKEHPSFPLAIAARIKERTKATKEFIEFALAFYAGK